MARTKEINMSYDQPYDSGIDLSKNKISYDDIIFRAIDQLRMSKTYQDYRLQAMNLSALMEHLKDMDYDLRNEYYTELLNSHKYYNYHLNIEYNFYILLANALLPLVCLLLIVHDYLLNP